MSIPEEKVTFRYVDHTIIHKGELIATLSPQEAALLGILVKYKGRLVTWDNMAEELWLHENDVKDPRANLRQHIKALRKILDPLGYSLDNIFGAGYRLWPVIHVDWTNPEDVRRGRK